MEVHGWVYAIVNEAMPGLVKVGYSLQDPQLRAVELSTTGVPRPFIVAYAAVVKMPRDIERAVHSKLLHRRDGKEWFKCGLHEVVESIREAAQGSLIAEIENDAFLSELRPVADALCLRCGKPISLVGRPRRRIHCFNCGALNLR